ncbi:MAG TPA: hypothetical protein VK866_11895 [Acidimicrobiales bacterium]|nr:hypothetical protein [Acidimicrobiales bacterium]
MRVIRTAGAAPSPARFAKVTAGAIGIGVGAGLMISGDVGVTPWDVLTTAIAGRTGWSVGVAGALMSLVLFAVCAPFGRLPGWGNLVLIVVASVSVDVMLAALDTPEAMALRIGYLALGTVILCGAVSLIVAADIGVGPLEMVMLVATDRGVALVRARVVIEGTVLLTGWALGGAIGLGTAAFAVAAGPLIAGWLRVLGHSVAPAPAPAT